MSVEVRRKAAENAFLRAQAAGRAVEQDESFHGAIRTSFDGMRRMKIGGARTRDILIFTTCW